jgi:hypothetical protein
MSAYRLRAYLMLFSFLCLATPVRAEDFTFNVPVRVSNLPPEIDRFRLDCLVSTEAGDIVGVGQFDQMLGPSARTFDAVISLAFNANRTADPSAARTWVCSIVFAGVLPWWGSDLVWFVGISDRGGPVELRSYGATSPSPPLRIPASGPFNVFVQGTLTPTRR